VNVILRVSNTRGAGVSVRRENEMVLFLVGLDTPTPMAVNMVRNLTDVDEHPAVHDACAYWRANYPTIADIAASQDKDLGEPWIGVG
jgi:hypothetical protein